MATKNYKKYMKKTNEKEYNLWQIFAFSFFGMLLIFTFLIKSFSPSVDVSIGDSNQGLEMNVSEEIKKNVDDRLAMIQDEDQGRSFSELMKKAEDAEKPDVKPLVSSKITEETEEKVEEAIKTPVSEPVYKVFIGTYTSAEQAKVAKDIIVESGSNLTPLVKCIGSNNYTLQVGIFKNKQSAEALLYTVQQNHLPGRIVAEY